MGSARLKSLKFYLDLICYDNSKTNHLYVCLRWLQNITEIVLYFYQLTLDFFIYLNLDCEIGFLTYIYRLYSLIPDGTHLIF